MSPAPPPTPTPPLPSYTPPDEVDKFKSAFAKHQDAVRASGPAGMPSSTPGAQAFVAPPSSSAAAPLPAHLAHIGKSKVRPRFPVPILVPRVKLNCTMPSLLMLSMLAGRPLLLMRLHRTNSNARSKRRPRRSRTKRTSSPSATAPTSSRRRSGRPRLS